MIVRRICARQGRRVLPTPFPRVNLRTITTDGLPQPPPRTGPLMPSGSQEAWGLKAQHKATTESSKATRALGSKMELRYAPGLLLKNPPKPKDITLEALMSAQTHMGHNASLWNPANSRYIYGERQGIHIISLETTAAHLRRAATVVEEVAYRGGLVLFVGTRRGQMEIVTRAASEAKACHLFTKWTPGAITNKDIILRDRLQKIVNEHDEVLPGFDRHLNEARPLQPDLVVCLNPLENFTLLRECGVASIPTIGIIDTDADPSWVTYTIPANDDSLRSVAFIAGVLGQAGKQGQKRRLTDAQNGQVTWETPNDVTRFINGMHRVRSSTLAALLDKELVGGASAEKSTATAEELLQQFADEGAQKRDGAATEEKRAEKEWMKAAEAEATATLNKQPVDAEATAIPNEQPADDIELLEELAEEEDALFEEMAAENIERDAMGEAERKYLESLKLKGNESEAALNETLMSGVGVEKSDKQATKSVESEKKAEDAPAATPPTKDE